METSGEGDDPISGTHRRRPARGGHSSAAMMSLIHDELRQVEEDLPPQLSRELEAVEDQPDERGEQHGRGLHPHLPAR